MQCPAEFPEGLLMQPLFILAILLTSLPTQLT